MTKLATVRAIDGGTRAEQAAADLAKQVDLGQLRPGEIIRIAGFAERYRATVASLRPLLRSLENQKLLFVRGDVVEIAPLDLMELRGVCRMRNLVEKHLAAQACERIGLRELTALRAELSNDATARPATVRHLSPAQRNMLGRLCSYGASNYEAAIYRDVQRPIHRHFHLSFRAISEDGDSALREELARHRETHRRRILEAFEQRDPRLVRAALDDCARFGQEVAELAFDHYPRLPMPRLL